MTNKSIYTNCVVCDAKLKGQQRKFCSRKCKDKNWHTVEPAYARQRRRGIKRKLKLVELKGGCCEICSYDKNLAVLTFHHTNPKTKLFNVELNNIANYNWKKVLEEAGKCQLLCQNCHQELHHPDFSLKKLLT